MREFMNLNRPADTLQIYKNLTQMGLVLNKYIKISEKTHSFSFMFSDGQRIENMMEIRFENNKNIISVAGETEIENTDNQNKKNPINDG